MIKERKSESDGIKREVSIDLEGATLEGTLTLPKGANGLVLFAHGSGSSRHSPRNRYVAQVLQSQGIATLLIDLLTRSEESIDQYSGELRFDIPFLAKRLIGATNWIMSSPDTKDLEWAISEPVPGPARRSWRLPSFPMSFLRSFPAEDDQILRKMLSTLFVPPRF